jgi:hypothetical protein
MTAVAVGEIKLPNYVKRIVVRVGAELAGEAGGRRLRLTTARIGNLPLHALPWGDRLVELCGKHFFQFEFYDTEWKLIQRASNVRLAAGKAVVSFGGGGAPAARQ